VLSSRRNGETANAATQAKRRDLLTLLQTLALGFAFSDITIIEWTGKSPEFRASA
jgi:hypothetical protein